MVQTCCVPHCKSSAGTKGKDGQPISLFSFPRLSDKRRKSWLERIRRDECSSWQVSKATKVCSEHFTSADIYYRGVGKYWYNRRLKDKAIPSRFAWSKVLQTRRNPLEERCEIAIVNEETLSCTQNIKSQDQHPPPDSEIENLKAQIKCLKERLQEQEKEIENLKELISNYDKKQFNFDRFKDNNSDIRFYTGFSCAEVFEQCYEFLNAGPHGENVIYWNSAVKETDYQFENLEENRQGELNMKRGRRRTLDSKTDFFLFLCRVRQGFREQHLAHLFNVSISAVCRIVITWSNFVYLRLGSLNIWPDRETIDSHMPDSIRLKYPSTRVIIDCSEIKVQTPSSLVLVSEFFSNYKNHVTLKALIGCTPSGGCSFVSQLFTGSISDVEMVKQSGFLNLPFDQGDSVMADRGFTISNILPKGVHLNIPAFLNGRHQFETEEVIQSQAIAQDRIHIERLINIIKNYHIFDGVIPLTLAGSINQLFTSCCLLSNFQPGIISSLPQVMSEE